MKKILLGIGVALLIALLIVTVVISQKSQRDTVQFLNQVDEFIEEVEK